MEARDMSFRKLEIQTGRYRDKAYTAGYLNQLATGRTKISPDSIPVIANALGVDAEYFVEWRRHVAAQRAAELTQQIGLEKVMKALDRLDGRSGS